MRIALVCLLLCACSGACNPVTPEPVEPVQPVQAGCAAACERGGELGCDWASPGPGRDGKVGTADDSECVEVCTHYEAKGIDLHNACVVAATSCMEADECQALPQ